MCKGGNTAHFYILVYYSEIPYPLILYGYLQGDTHTGLVLRNHAVAITAPQDAPAVKTLEFGADRRYFYLDERGYIERIHSLFTIFGRCIFSSGTHPSLRHFFGCWSPMMGSMPDPFGFLLANLF
jgi:hypothetical protein